ncbi:hypothetical protein HRD49_14710 [Corallococcus exiguus]|uniref:hypothetical protein n=1 Tax=Corallococcus exiguus TaxID=83462 RepID=UPI0010D724BF|nr:hypothetical protein [Corallococcus exiguus]NRD62998.1 hypothetical protein [Corallococcus exiguus]RYZ34984.1 MAG: hypothetical protein EOO71_37225 [Myxococcaceae bacterium]
MFWHDEWKAWSLRLSATNELLQLFSAAAPLLSSTAPLNETAKPELRELFSLLKQFHSDFQKQLHPKAARAIENFILSSEQRRTFMPESGPDSAFHMACVLGTIRAQVDYIHTDKQARARRMSERAFTHLQRTLVADFGFRLKWIRALRESRAEDACEKLGAVHLLLHGIWAFKADAKGGKTDLVLSQPLSEDEAALAADAMVLTEWKVVREDDSPEEQAKKARAQAERYAGETLAGFELATHRYLILVSEDFIKPLPVISPRGDITYEVRNIAVSPSSPSVMAAAAARIEDI